MTVFHSKVEQFKDTRLWSHHFKIAPEIAKKFIDGKDRRVLCSINGEKPFQCAIMRGTDDLFFINLNKSVRDKMGLLDGELIKISLEKDKSAYGLPFPIELREVLDTDPEANQHFESLTPGKKRNLLYIVNQPKSEAKRIEKAIVIANHLKKMNGKIDFKVLNEDFRNFKF
jgi:hypothetical protein